VCGVVTVVVAVAVYVGCVVVADVVVGRGGVAGRVVYVVCFVVGFGCV